MRNAPWLRFVVEVCFINSNWLRRSYKTTIFWSISNISHRICIPDIQHFISALKTRTGNVAASEIIICIMVDFTQSSLNRWLKKATLSTVVSVHHILLKSLQSVQCLYPISIWIPLGTKLEWHLPKFVSIF